MAQLTIVYWRDIPAQVIVKLGRQSEKAPLSERFEKAIDRAAMRAGLTGTDAYLSEWRRATPIEVSDDLVMECKNAVKNLEDEFTDDLLKTLIQQSGHRHV